MNAPLGGIDVHTTTHDRLPQSGLSLGRDPDIRQKLVGRLPRKERAQIFEEATQAMPE